MAVLDNPLFYALLGIMRYRDLILEEPGKVGLSVTLAKGLFEGVLWDEAEELLENIERKTQ